MTRASLHYPLSRIVRSHVPELLKFVPAPLVALAAGLPLAQVRTLKSDPRVLPPVRLIEKLCLRLGVKPTQILSLETAATLRDIAPAWFSDGTGKAKIAICGMGNLGHALAGTLGARPDISIRVLVSDAARAEQVERDIAATGGIRVLRDGPDLVSHPDVITHVSEDAVGDADLVILCVPGHVHLPLMRKVVTCMRDGSYLTAIPAAGGFNWKAQAVLEETGRNLGVFGIGAVPWMCKLQGPATVKISDGKKLNALQALCAADSVFVTDIMSLLLGMPMIEMGSFLNINLGPANQLLHPGIMYSLFRDWSGEPLAQAPLFYQGLSDDGARVLQALSDELVGVARGIHARVPDYWMSSTVSLHTGIRIGYDGQIADSSTLRNTIVTNRAYQGVRTPMLAVPGGLAPNFGSRFFIEDIPHGMAILKGVAEIVGIQTPTTDSVMQWCQQKMGREYLVRGRLGGRDVSETAAPQVFGITTPEKLVASCMPAPSR